MARTENPYDRREQPKRNVGAHDEFVDLGYAPVHILDDGRRAYPGLTLARLEDLLRDEFARGYNVGEGTEERKTEEVILPRVQRKVWAEGHQAGVLDGRAELLTAIAEQFEEQANGVKAALITALDDDRATKAALRDTMQGALHLVAKLIESHHNAFVSKPPF